jgi:hypothetical protein
VEKVLACLEMFASEVMPKFRTGLTVRKRA